MNGVAEDLPVGTPDRWWVYTHHAADGQVIYVGCSIRPQHRQYEHSRYATWWGQVADIKVIGPWRVRRAALRAEANLIRFFDPENNLKHTPRVHAFYSAVRNRARNRGPLTYAEFTS